MKETNTGTIDYYIKRDGLHAARSILPQFQWDKIRERWNTINEIQKFAALILRREQLTEDVNIVISTELLEIFLEDKDELRIYANGDVKLESIDHRICHDNLKRG